MQVISIGMLSSPILLEELCNGKAVEDTHHESLAFYIGLLKRAQLRWPTVDKKGFAIVG